MLPFLKAFFMQSNLAETKQKLSTFLKEGDRFHSRDGHQFFNWEGVVGLMLWWYKRKISRFKILTGWHGWHENTQTYLVEVVTTMQHQILLTNLHGNV